jgi:hypothetical protein
MCGGRGGEGGHLAGRYQMGLWDYSGRWRVPAYCMMGMAESTVETLVIWYWWR